MEKVITAGAIIKKYIELRGKNIKEIAAELDIPYNTFSGKLKRDSEGMTSRDITPTGAGKWVEKNKDAHEKWNFLNYDGYCYGFVQNKGQFHIEHFKDVRSNAEVTDGVTIIWCASLANGKKVIVGWYENAEMYSPRGEAGKNRLFGTDF